MTTAATKPSLRTGHSYTTGACRRLSGWPPTTPTPGHVPEYLAASRRSSPSALRREPVLALSLRCAALGQSQQKRPTAHLRGRLPVCREPAPIGSDGSEPRRLRAVYVVHWRLFECHEEGPPRREHWVLVGTSTKEAPTPCCILDLTSAESDSTSACSTKLAQSSPSPSPSRSRRAPSPRQGSGGPRRTGERGDRVDERCPLCHDSLELMDGHRDRRRAEGEGSRTTRCQDRQDRRVGPRRALRRRSRAGDMAPGPEIRAERSGPASGSISCATG